ncbi:hypothetical protein [Streptomyces sp. A30]|uniref:hypothetical protein n=1 Tax=Streptomyces sp. A30 TaxID=2789273 RepID=UPI00397F7EFF
MSTQGTPDRSTTIKVLWVTVAVLLSAVVALLAGILVRILGKEAADALLAAGAAFLGVLTVILTTIKWFDVGE